MRRSSYAIIACLVLAFTAFQGWLFLRTFWFAEPVTSVEAQLLRETVTIGTPVAGLVEEVHVELHQEVAKDDILLTVIPQSPQQPSGGRSLFLRAPRDGIVRTLETTEGDFVRASQELASVVDTDQTKSFVEASFSISPEQWKRLSSGLPAMVEIAYFTKEKDFHGVIASVSPFYDYEKHLADVRLHIVDTFPEEDRSFPSGLPVEVTVRLPNESAFRRGVLWFAGVVFPPSIAKVFR
jgi:multidrug resistance efflux pump